MKNTMFSRHNLINNINNGSINMGTFAFWVILLFGRAKRQCLEP